jgi:hypothetical protein
VGYWHTAWRMPLLPTWCSILLLRFFNVYFKYKDMAGKSEIRSQKLEISSILCPLSSVLKFSILWLRVCPLCRKATVEEGVGKKPQWDTGTRRALYRSGAGRGVCHCCPRGVPLNKWRFILRSRYYGERKN